MMKCEALLCCIFAIWCMPINANDDDEYIPPPWKPQTKWDRPGIETILPNPMTARLNCSNPSVSQSSAYYCDPNKKLSSSDGSTVVKSLEEMTAAAANKKGLSVGLIVLNQVSPASLDIAGPSAQDLKNQVKAFGDLSLDKWNERMNYKCVGCILLLVSCTDSVWYEAKESTFLNEVNLKCHKAFSSSGAVVVNGATDCYRDIIKPRLDLYKTINDGTNDCLKPEHTVSYSAFITVLVFCVIFAVGLIVVPCVIYWLMQKKLKELKQITVQLVEEKERILIQTESPQKK